MYWNISTDAHWNIGIADEKQKISTDLRDELLRPPGTNTKSQKQTETAVLYISLVANKHPMSQYNGRSQRPLPLCIQKKAACNSKREQMLIHANDSLNINRDVTMCCTAVMDTTTEQRGKSHHHHPCKESAQNESTCIRYQGQTAFMCCTRLEGVERHNTKGQNEWYKWY